MWAETKSNLKRDFEFKDFKQAFAFMTEVAEVADRLDHHPEWSNVYNKVTITLSTHDQGSVVTEKDYELQAEIDKIFVHFSQNI